MRKFKVPRCTGSHSSKQGIVVAEVMAVVVREEAAAVAVVVREEAPAAAAGKAPEGNEQTYLEEDSPPR